MDNTSAHAYVLNELEDMKKTFVYALRRDLIDKVQRLILSQEREIKRLKIEIEQDKFKSLKGITRNQNRVDLNTSQPDLRVEPTIVYHSSMQILPGTR